MALLIFKVVAMVAIVAVCIVVIYGLFMPSVESIPPERRRTVAWRMAAFFVLAPLALMVLEAEVWGRHRNYFDVLSGTASVPTGYLLCLAVLAIRGWRKQVR